MPAPPERRRRALASIALAATALPADRGSNLQLTDPLLWTMIAISAAGAIVTFAFLVYAVLRFRDPATRRRRYG